MGVFIHAETTPVPEPYTILDVAGRACTYAWSDGQSIMLKGDRQAAGGVYGVTFFNNGSAASCLFQTVRACPH